MWKRFPIIVALVLIGAGTASANIQNGDFEIPVPTDGTGGGWTSSNNGDGWYATGGHPGGVFVLNAGGSYDTDPTIEQLVTGLTPGASYRLTGDYAIYYTGWTCYMSPNGQLGIDLNGTNLTKVGSPECNPNWMTWYSFSVDFVAPSDNVTIAFRAEIDGADTDYAIDTISLAYVGVVSPDITVTDSVAPVNDNQVLFGSVTTGTSSDQTVTVQNDGNTDLVLGSVAGADPLATPFSVVSDSCSGQTLAPAASCALTVRFAPSTVGAASDSFDIPSDDPDENPVTISVGGTGIAPPAPDISVTDTLGNGSDLAMPFPDTTEGVTSSAETVTISNGGNATLNVSAIQLSGANPAEFVLDVDSGANPCGDTTPVLAAGDNCTVTVAFAPASAGAKAATLAIASDDPDEAAVNVALTGTGLSAVTNNPPGKPALVFPANGQTGLSSTVTFAWNPVTDPDGDPVGYDLYYCADPDPLNNCAPVQVASRRGEVAYAGMTSGAGTLALSMLLAAVFLAVPSLRKKVLLLAAGVVLIGSLTVSCGDTDRGNYVTYTATGLSSGTACYWAVVAKDDQGGTTASDAWQFTTQ